MLRQEEKERYSRQILLSNIGEEGQEKLKQAKVLVIGAGGLAATAAQYLASSGVGHIRIVDGDKVERSNLARQILYTADDIGKKKAILTGARLQSLNPEIKVEVHDVYFGPENAEELLNDMELVLDCTDNYRTRYALDDLCAKHSIPLIYAALHKYEGQISVFHYDGGPSYRSLFPDEDKAQNIPTCVEVGVFSTLAGLMGMWQANEALKIILGIGGVLSGKMLNVNVLNNKIYETEFEAIEQ